MPVGAIELFRTTFPSGSRRAGSTNFANHPLRVRGRVDVLSRAPNSAAAHRLRADHIALVDEELGLDSRPGARGRSGNPVTRNFRDLLKPPQQARDSANRSKPKLRDLPQVQPDQ